MRNDIESLARKMTGNWRKFDSFCWHRQYDLESPEDWTIVYTHGRDSGLVAQSNAHAIQTAMRPFLDTENPDVIEEHHGHWGCGWIDGYAIRVFRNEEITPAFQAWANLHFCMQDYPLLDEEDYSRREYEATIENMSQECSLSRLDDEFTLPDRWESEVFSWLWNHNQRAVASRDDAGGYPSKDDLADAFTALGYPNLTGD